MSAKPCRLTRTRLNVLKDLAQGRILVFRPGALYQPASYRWLDSPRKVHYITVKPLEDAWLVTVHPTIYHQRVITEAGRKALESAGMT